LRRLEHLFSFISTGGFAMSQRARFLENGMGRFQAVLASRERRSARRYGVQVNAEIAADEQSPPQRCLIHDISQTGALIEVKDGDVVEDFTLTFSRRCRVVRQTEDGKFGVQFLLPWSADMDA